MDELTNDVLANLILVSMNSSAALLFLLLEREQQAKPLSIHDS